MDNCNQFPNKEQMEFWIEQGRKEGRMLMPETKEYYGHHYYMTEDGPAHIAEFDPKRPPYRTFSTLTGIVDYINNDIDKHYEKHDALQLQVVSPDRVALTSPIWGVERKFDTLAIAQAELPKIPFDNYMDGETFSIMMQTRFVDDVNRSGLLEFTGNIEVGEKEEIADDGVSQKLTVRSGVEGNKKKNFSNPAWLCPIRSFHEIDQVVAPFILRFSTEKEVRIALFEGDGGAWKLEACKRVAEYLKEFINPARDVNIIA